MSVQLLISGLLLASSLVASLRHRQLSKPVQAAAFLAVVSVFLESAVAVYKHLHGAGNNTPLYNFYILLEGSVLLYSAASERLRSRALLLPAVFVGTWMLNAYFRPLDRLFSEAFLLECLSVPLLCLAHLLDRIRRGHPVSIPEACTYTGLILYFSCNVPLFSFLNYLIDRDNVPLAHQLYRINHGLSILRYGLLLTGLLAASPPRTPLSQNAS